MEMPEHDHLLDIQGLCCSAPVIRLSQAFRTFGNGEIVLVVSDKVSMVRDIPAYCNMTAHSLLQQREREGLYYFWIRKQSNGA